MDSTCASTALSSTSDTVERVAPKRVGMLQVFPYTPHGDRCVWDVERSVQIGRGADAEIRLADEHVSRRHASIDLVPGGLRVIDVESKHGTHVDGRTVGARGVVAHCGSVLRVGHTLLLVVSEVEAHSAPIHRVSGAFLGLPHDLLAGPNLWSVWQEVSRVATLSYPVLIVGESGSGKEATARMLHSAQPSQGPFVAVNIAASAGATGDAQLEALFRAPGGLLFLDEVADLRMESQAALLRLMSESRVRTTDGSPVVPPPVRLIAATSRDLQRASMEGLFRRDLCDRLSSVVLRMPPLRERRADIIPIAQSIIDAQSEQLSLSMRAAEILLLAPWEGNVRQLDQVVVRAVVGALGSPSKRIQPEHLSIMWSSLSVARGDECAGRELVSALRNAKGNVSAAAKALGVSRATLYNLFKRYGVDPRFVRKDPR